MLAQARSLALASVAQLFALQSVSASPGTPPATAAESKGADARPAASDTASKPASAPNAPAKPATPAVAVAKKPAPAKSAAHALRDAEAKLSAQDAASVSAGLQSLAAIGGEPAARVIAARLRRGLPPQLIEPAIAALQQLGRPSVGPVLLELALHRRPQVRKRAFEALAALHIRSAQSVLLYALDDPSADVRGAAIAALAVVGDARALPALLEADARGAAGALAAVGRIAKPRDVKPLLGRVQDGDLTRVRPALEVMLDRPDFPLQGKLAIVRQVAALGSPNARLHLVQWLDARKASGNPRLRQALFDAIKRVDLGPQPTTAAKAKAPASTPEPMASLESGKKP